MVSSHQKGWALGNALEIAKAYATSSDHGVGQVDHVLEKVYEKILELKGRADKDD
jgi:hypothetical protein